MSNACTHTLSSGRKCQAPAANGGNSFCRHHDPRRSTRQDEEDSLEGEPLALPMLVDKPSTLAALNVVLQALAARRIKRSVAVTLLSGIKLANRLLTDIAEPGETASPTSNYIQPAHSEPAVRPQKSGPGSSAPQTVVRLAASRHPVKPAAIFNSERFVEELMEQAYQFLPGEPRPDPRFLSI